MIAPLQRRRQRRALRDLDQLWAGPSTSASRALRRELHRSPALRRAADQLVGFEAALAEAVAIVSEERGLSHSREPSAVDFERRLRLAQSDPASHQGASWGLGLAAAAAAAALTLGRGVTPTPDDPDTSLIARGEDNEMVSLSALCLSAAPPHAPTSAEDADAVLRCRLDQALQPTLTYGGTEPRHVSAFAITPDGELVPYAPSPGEPWSTRLDDTGAAQPIGGAHRLDVNHRPGPYWLVVIGTDRPLDWSSLERTRPLWSQVEVDKAPTAAAVRVLAEALDTTSPIRPEFIVARQLIITPPEP